jgi:hypothetical protein
MDAAPTDEEVVIDGAQVPGRNGGEAHLFAHKRLDM